MKKMLANFNLNILNKSQLALIRGGGCTLTVDYGPDCGNSTTSTHATSSDAAYALRVAKAKPGYSGYTLNCAVQ